MLATQELVLPIRMATVVVPVALYFLILGLLNSRRRPQLLSGAMDRALLLGALSPLLLVPMAGLLGVGATLAIAAAVVAALAVRAALARGGEWVIYNVEPDQAMRAAQDAADAMGLGARLQIGETQLPGGGTVRVSAFPLLRNVSIRLHGMDRANRDRFAAGLWASLGRTEAPTTPMAVSLLLVATAMLIAPLVTMANRLPEMARLVTDLLH